MSHVRVRFPPSPTGYCHVGTARMAIVNYLFAKKHNGTIIFRSEDTDKDRSSREFEEDIKDSFTWLGLSWDEFYRQSERSDIYRAAIVRLIAEKKAYESEEESKKEVGKRVRVIRLRNPGKMITFSDAIRGDITFDTTELKDFVIARSESDPLYHLAVVIDDAGMGVTHVIRGEDHISNTPRQILIQEALGAERPIYAHYPLHLSPDRAKLSKRRGDVSVRSYREKGFLPSALINYLATLGWTPHSGREILSLAEMVEEFDLSGLHKSGAVFDVEKLRWFNREYLVNFSDTTFVEEALPWLEKSLTKFKWNEVIARRIVPLFRERISVWSDIVALADAGEFDYFFVVPSFDANKIPMKKISVAETAEHLRQVCKILESEIEYTSARIKDALWPYATEKGRGAVLWPLRFALTGREQSPDPFQVSAILGKEETLGRVRRAIDAISPSLGSADTS